VVVTLDEGTVLPKNNVSSHAGFIAGFTGIAENIVRQRLGHDSQRRYFYGFSMMGRHVQYQPGARGSGHDTLGHRRPPVKALISIPP
jgi:hypothetical protein